MEIHPIAARIMRTHELNRRNYSNERPIFDARDAALLRARIAKRKAITRPLQGDYVRFTDGSYQRIAHVYGDRLQPSCGAYGCSVYLHKSGIGEFSGGLNSAIPKSRITFTNTFRAAVFWFFHHDHARAHCGVHCYAPARVWLVEGETQ